MSQDKDNTFQWFVNNAFGSDELSPYTAEYAWMSNQMAHAMMGFALAVVWLLLVVTFGSQQSSQASDVWLKQAARTFRNSLPSIPRDAYVVLLFALIPIKEVVDIFLDRSRFASSPIPPNFWALVFDSLTDISFWWSGMFLAAVIVGAFVEGWARALIPLAGLGICIPFWYFYAAPQWLTQKRIFDQSRMPFNYMRLAQLAAKNSEESFFDPDSPVIWDHLRTFREEVAKAGRPEQRHYVIYGGSPANRSNLAISLGSEFAFKLRPGEYTRDEVKLTRVYYTSAPTILEKPKELEVILDPAVVECVVINHLDTAVTLPRKTSPAAVARVIENMPVPKESVSELTKKYSLPKMDEAGQVDGLDEKSKPKDFDDANPGPPTAAQMEADIRRAKFDVLGKIAKDNKISTVWVLSGDRSSPSWEANRRRWMEDIAHLICGGDQSALTVIVLKD